MKKITDLALEDKDIGLLLAKLYKGKRMPEEICQKKAFAELCKYFENESNLPLRYSAISLFVYQYDQASDFIAALKEAFEKKYAENKALPLGIIKLVNHLDLAVNQVEQFGSKNELEGQIQSLKTDLTLSRQKLEDQKKELNITKQELEDQKKELNITKQKFKKIQNAQNSIYTSFITVLGLFASLLFALFGGFKSAVDVANAPHSLSDFLVVVGAIGLIMVCTIFIFFNFLLALHSFNHKSDFEFKKLVKKIKFWWICIALISLIILGIILKGVFKM